MYRRSAHSIRAEGIRVWGALGDATGHFLLISGNVSQVKVLSEKTETPKPKTPKPLTRAQKLAKALAECRKKHNKHARQVCERAARKKFGPVKSARKSAHRSAHNSSASTKGRA